MLTLLHLEIGIHYNSRVVDIENLDAPAVAEYMQHLLDAGLMQHGGDCGTKSYGLTPKGRYWLDALLSVPFPEPTWVIQWPQP